MPYIKRKYRTNLSMKAIIFIDGSELDCTIVNLSTSGAKLEVKPGSHFKNAMLLSEIVNKDDIVNFTIPEMHLDGEVKIIRTEIQYNNFYLSIVLENVFYGLEYVPYRRRVYRSNYRSIGHIEINGRSYEFLSYNVSVKGMLLGIFERLNINNGDILAVDLNQLNIHGKARIIWTKKLYNKNLLGLEYIDLIEPVKGIASFKRQEFI